MNELQLKLEKRRNSMADMDSGIRLDRTVSSQKTVSGSAAPPSSAAQNEMLAKLERRRRLNEEGASPEVEAVTLVPVVEEVTVPPPPAPAPTVDAPEPAPCSALESTPDTVRTEIDSGSIPAGRPPVPQRSHRQPPPVPPSRAPPAPASPSPVDEGGSHSGSYVDLSGLSMHSNEVGSSAAALVLPWNQGIHSLRERKTPDKHERGNTGLNEAHAKQHRRRKSVQMKLSSDFDVSQALAAAGTDTLLAILNELELELGPGAFTIAIRKMFGQRAVSKLRDMEASKAVLSNIVLDLASVLGIEAYKDMVEQLHLNQARDAALDDTPRGSDTGTPRECEPHTLPFQLLTICRETGKWSIPEGTPDLIAAIMERFVECPPKSPLKVIGAIGGIHKGKSYFLNRVAGRQSGFGIGNDTNHTRTEGVWAWFKPDSNIVLIDTAGMFDSRRRNKKLDEQLFACTAVLSSLLIYNTVGGVDENALCDFGNTSRLAKTLYRKQQRLRRGAEPKPEGELPPLLWLIRDFSLSLSHYEGSCDKYLQKQLVPVKDDYTDNLVTIMNEARETIKAMFPVIGCVTMSKPFVSKEILSQLDAYPFHSLPPDFQLSANLAVDAVLNAAPEKKFTKIPDELNGTVSPSDVLPATPRVMLQYAEGLCEALNGTIPLELNALWDYMQTRDQGPSS